MLVALSQLTLPLAAIVLLSATASAIARHPAISLAVALVLLLAPDLARLWYPEHDGWLLTSHMPWFWRDQSVLSYLDATARGAADALWLHADLAVWAPLAWMAVAAVALATLVQRMRIS
jgi:hypothetical protein